MNHPSNDAICLIFCLWLQRLFDSALADPITGPKGLATPIRTISYKEAHRAGYRSRKLE